MNSSFIFMNFIGVKLGGVVVLERGERFVYYFIIKIKYSDKFIYDSFRFSLEVMKEYCIKYKVK